MQEYNKKDRKLKTKIGLQVFDKIALIILGGLYGRDWHIWLLLGLFYTV